MTAPKEAVDIISPDLNTQCLSDFPELWVHILQYTLIYDAILTTDWALLLLTAIE